MGYYDLNKQQRLQMSLEIFDAIRSSIYKGTALEDIRYTADADTYIRKAAYRAIGRVYKDEPAIRRKVIANIRHSLLAKDALARQTMVNAIGEIGLCEPMIVAEFFKVAAEDESPKVRNAVIGSLKKVGQRHPEVVTKFALENINNSNLEVKRIAMHGLELRGRTHPEEVMPILKMFQEETKTRLRKMLIHVVGQISYKQNCLVKVLEDLKGWRTDVITDVLKEIYAVHVYYSDFASHSSEEARQIMLVEFQNILNEGQIKEIEDINIGPGKKVAGRES